MAKINSSFKYQSFRYNFAVDGGAISSIPMGIFLPACKILGTLIVPVVNLAGAGAIVDLGVVGVPSDIIDNANMGVTGTFADYNDAGFGFSTGIGIAAATAGGTFVPSSANLPLAAGQVILTISAFALTAGQFTGTIFYLEFP